MPTRLLPIWNLHESILATFHQGQRLVLVAPTGSGKTTQVPQMLLDAGFAGDRQRIVVLQPRRVAARTVAARVAWERQCRLGTEVGYQIRFDDCTSLGTRICFVTEGILLRWLQEDPSLKHVAVILFDEFHERNLLSDVALALTKNIQATTRPDLKLAVMSATLDAEPVADYLEDAPILISGGVSHPVDVHYLDYDDRRPSTEQAADTVHRIIESGSAGDILVFMPGMAEINATLSAIQASRLHEPAALIPLHGDLPPEQQDLAFLPHGSRKIVVATNVAETSVTIDGVRHVVDSGLARVARYDADRGVNTLIIEPISRASADQRCGRAGRTAPGTCWRLWTESGHLNRPERNTPEIQRSDLAEVVLLLHSLGIRDARHFDWLDRPDPQAVERAEKLLHTLGAIHPQTEALTPIGLQMLRLPIHPRYARMLVEAAARRCIPSAALCAALVSGRDLLMRVPRGDDRMAEAREVFEASAQSDFYTLMRAYMFAKKNQFRLDACRRSGIHAQTAKQVEQTLEQILNVARQQRLLPPPRESPEELEDHPADDALPRCLLSGFADQLAIRRDTGTLECDLTEGRQGTLMRESVVQQAHLFVVASIREIEGGARPLTLLGLATAVKREWVEEMFPGQISTAIEHRVDRHHKRVAAVRLVRFQDLVIHHEHQRELDPAASGHALAEAFAKGWFELPNLSYELRQFMARVNLVSKAMPDLGFTCFDTASLTHCLARAFHGLSLIKEAQSIDLKPSFFACLDPTLHAWLQELAPATIPWTNGKPVKLGYIDDLEPSTARHTPPETQVKLLDCFDLQSHPSICEQRVPVKLWLQTPDGKRLESTCDWLQWKVQHYPRHRPTLVKKYPGHVWR